MTRYNQPVSVETEVFTGLDSLYLDSMQRMIYFEYNLNKPADPEDPQNNMDIKRSNREISILEFGLYAVTRHMARTGKVQSVSDSFFCDYPWIEAAAKDIHFSLGQLGSGPHFDTKNTQTEPRLQGLSIVRLFEKQGNPYFGDDNAKHSLNREVSGRVPVSAPIAMADFCIAVSQGNVKLDLSDLRTSQKAITQ